MIVIPMAGRSQRFFDAGYAEAKYRLSLAGRSVFAHAAASFEALFRSEPFLFVVGADPDAEAFVRAECAELGVADLQVIVLDRPTRGQAETVEFGLAAAGVGDELAITIFNIDTFRPGYTAPGPPLSGIDGWLEVFRGSGSNWSYVRPGPDGFVAETAEKRPISDLCCTGLYHFARVGDFLWALERERASPQASELYVAPIYNHLIGRGACIGYSLIDRSQVVFCGTPAEYRGLVIAAS